ncbi:hypothetical protein [Methylobacterium goesingense]|uniref:Uncharacterized protein n=1 Tax=Methylobacterium goesingense TaxID=243690 RepID=A0ABV2L4X1_9HYPH|nr:hypothetical protein [Methylobacterium goesingense]GJD72063.1 hypothetical protein CFIICLFH_0273 [Methylobacterium goesingense]
MSTISANSAAPPRLPPRHHVSQGDLSARTIGESSPTDAASPGTGTSGTTATEVSTDADRLDPGSLPDRIDDLLTQQVGNGNLTQTQADTLKSAFENLGGGTDGVGARQRPQGPPPGPPPDASGSGSGTSDASSESTGTTSADDLLATFVKQLQTAQNQSRAYAADGTRSGSQTASALLLNFTA